MKRFLLSTIICLLTINTIAQQASTYKISYNLLIKDAAGNNNEGDLLNDFLKAMAASDSGKTNAMAEVFVNKDKVRINTLFLPSNYTITDKLSNETFVVNSEEKKYSPQIYIPQYLMDESLSDIDFSELPIEYDPTQTKTIAGYPCKLAKVKLTLEQGTIETQIWYTEKIPSIIWSEYPYLTKIPGATLHISSQGYGLEAYEVETVEHDENLFSIPEDYTLENINGLVDNWEIAPNRFVFSENELYGIKDNNDNIITPATYSYIYDSFEGYIVASDPEYNYGIIDENGKIIIPFEYENLSLDKTNNLILYSSNNLFGYLDFKGNIIIPAKYESISFFIDNKAVFTLKEKSGIIDIKQNILIPAVHENISEVNNDYFICIDSHEKYHIYSIANNTKVLGDFDYVFSAGLKNLFIVAKDNIYRYVYGSGKPFINMKFSSASSFDQGIATAIPVDSDDTIEINEQGEIIQ